MRALRPLRTITRFDSLRAIVVCFLEVSLQLQICVCLHLADDQNFLTVLAPAAVSVTLQSQTILHIDLWVMSLQVYMALTAISLL